MKRFGKFGRSLVNRQWSAPQVLAPLALLLSGLLMASCQTKPITILTTVSAECNALHPRTFAWPANCEFGKPCPDTAANAYDTERTAREAMADNAALKEICPDLFKENPHG